MQSQQLNWALNKNSYPECVGFRATEQKLNILEKQWALYVLILLET
jgi:hypothetical protein